MEENYLKLLLSWPSKWRTRKIQQHPDILEFLNKKFPNVPLILQVNAFINNVSPYCKICNNVVKFTGKQTCSIECRTEYFSEYQQDRVKKQKETLLKKYGVDNIRKIPETEEKRKDTMVKKYGGLVSEKSRESARNRVNQLIEKGRETLQEKYGVSNPGQLKDHATKHRSTMLKKYGVDHYSKTENFKQSQKEKLLDKWTAVFPRSIKLMSIDENTTKLNLFENPNKEIKFVCTTCDSTETIPTETAKWRTKQTGTPCRSCGGINLGSLKQLQLHQFIQELGVVVDANFVLDNNRQIDIFCPEYNIGFEFNGLFWHNDTRTDKKYHALKTLAAESQGIRLIHIFEDEWDHRQEIVKSRIRNLLSKNVKKIAARNCQIQIVDSKIEKQFFEQNHIQGHANSSVAIGLYYKDQLVSLMSFSKPNSAKGQMYQLGNWELLRFASVLDTSVIGAAGKLLKYFIKNYNPIQILSFADRRWSQGNLYQTLGFVNQGNTALNYWYINLKEGRRIHRYKLRKNKSDDPQLTEYQNRLNQGYLRIWDCGSSKWIWTKK